jgi:hypothetical protein
MKLKDMLKDHSLWSNRTVIPRQTTLLHSCDQNRLYGQRPVLPAYNVQFGIADEYIAVADVSQYRSTWIVSFLTGEIS